ncbi:MAG TPA: phosphoribosylamine--glycine ligase [Candidatus Faecicola pullistercoris]|nr:phosphoribosylamine--glycine ligase [Candidatus Faecicola pullistercoris]
MKKYNIAVIGGGGREHAICAQLKKSPRTDNLYCIPGNAGISGICTCEKLSVFDFDGIEKFCKANAVDLVFVAPDDPLAKGLVNFLTEKGLRAFGPTREAAQLESSKVFSKAFMQRHGIPTAKHRSFSDYSEAERYLLEADMPIVLKADGLALGKGVLICEDRESALKGLKELMLDGKFGDAGSNIVIEEFLKGREVTVLAFCDGNTVKCMPSSQDHKRAFDGDKGLNTGGMGAFAPSPYFTRAMQEELMNKIALPTVNGLKEEGIIFKGVIYFGLMMTATGLKVIEYNARFGDPETQVVLPLLKTDFVDIVNACIDGTLDSLDIEWEDFTALTVVVASGGYPENVVKGYPVEIGDTRDVEIFHAGTAFDAQGRLVTNGGRVFDVTATGRDIAEAREKVYAQIDKIRFTDARYRKDIGLV